jgi:hypothetical protein
MLDIAMFREEKGGNPDLIRESQRRRFESVELVDEVIAKDQEWRDGLLPLWRSPFLLTFPPQLVVPLMKQTEPSTRSARRSPKS